MFERFGLTPSQEALYRHLLVAPDDSVPSLASRLGLPLDAIEDNLTTLAEHRILKARPSAPTGYVALPPDHVLEVLITQEEERLEEQRRALHATREDIPDLVRDYVSQRTTAVGSEVEHLEDPLLVHSRLYQLANDADSWIWGTHLGAALDENSIEAGLVLDRASSARGTRHRMIVSMESLGVPHWDAYLDELVTLQHELRVMPAVPLLCLIFDGQHAVIPGPGKEGIGAYVLHGPHLVAPVMHLYQELWTLALRYGETAPGASDTHFSEARMQQVAALLARGLKDDAVARRLGISVRTVRRIIAAMAERLSAESRFQAGFLAARTGWVDPQD